MTKNIFDGGQVRTDDTERKARILFMFFFTVKNIWFFTKFDINLNNTYIRKEVRSKIKENIYTDLLQMRDRTLGCKGLEYKLFFVFFDSHNLHSKLS